MKIAFIIDPLDQLKPEKDSTLEMMRVAQSRGHRLQVIEPGGLNLIEGAVVARTMALIPDDREGCGYTREPEQWLPLTDFDAVLMRKDPPFDMEYVVATYLLEHAESQGARIFNRPRALRDFNEKFVTARFPQWAPPLVVARDRTVLKHFIQEVGDVILKPLDGMGGREIFRIRLGDPNLNVILESLTREGERTIMAQRYLPEITAGDKRILMVDGEVMPYCLARLPAPGETRGNLAVGGSARAQPLSDTDRQIGAAVGPFLREAGILLAGLDVIGTHLTEINITSPTCLREIRDQTGFDIAARVIDALESRCNVSIQ